MVVRRTFKIYTRDFPGGPVVEKLPANAGDTGSIPVWARYHKLWGNLARAPQLLSLQSKLHTCSRAHVLLPHTDSICLEPMLCNEKSTEWEVCTPQLESSPRSWKLEKASMQQWRPNIAKYKLKKKNLHLSSFLCLNLLLIYTFTYRRKTKFLACCISSSLTWSLPAFLHLTWASGPLHLLFPLPRTCSTQILYDSLPCFF